MPPTDRSSPMLVRALLASSTGATIVTSAVLLLLAGAAWVYLISSSMGMDAMHGRRMESHAGMEMSRSTLAEGTTFVAAWAVMMTAMMLPSALPMIALYGAIQRKALDPTTRGLPVALFALVYLGVWAVTGVPVYLAGRLFGDVGMDARAYGVAAVLIAAGIYQFTPLKRACLRVCRSPLGFLLGRWRAGSWASVTLGWSHAAYCLGCCWVLMVVLVAAGAMGLPWVFAIAGLVAAEKLVPGGEWIARAAGGVLVVLGVAILSRPDLATLLRGGH